jgi:hypothetical protein
MAERATSSGCTSQRRSPRKAGSTGDTSKGLYRRPRALCRRRTCRAGAKPLPQSHRQGWLGSIRGQTPGTSSGLPGRSLAGTTPAAPRR